MFLLFYLHFLFQKTSSLVWGMVSYSRFLGVGITEDLGCPLFTFTRQNSGKNYCHSGSCSQLLGNPIAVMSILGYSDNKASIFAFISLLGEMTSRKYLIMHRLKYILRESVCKEIQWPIIRLGIIGLMVFCLFQTRA